MSYTVKGCVCVWGGGEFGPAPFIQEWVGVVPPANPFPMLKLKSSAAAN